MIYLSFHANISYLSSQFVERALSREAEQESPQATILLTTGGGDSAAGIGLHHFIKALPYPVHVHAAGMCASGGVSLLLAAKKRTCSPGTHFMLHGSTAPDGSLSPQSVIMSDIFKVFGWGELDTKYFFSDVSEKWFDSEEALRRSVVESVEPFKFPIETSILIVPN